MTLVFHHFSYLVCYNFGGMDVQGLLITDHVKLKLSSLLFFAARYFSTLYVWSISSLKHCIVGLFLDILIYVQFNCFPRIIIWSAIFWAFFAYMYVAYKTVFKDNVSWYILYCLEKFDISLQKSWESKHSKNRWFIVSSSSLQKVHSSDCTKPIGFRRVLV